MKTTLHATSDKTAAEDDASFGSTPTRRESSPHDRASVSVRTLLVGGGCALGAAAVVGLIGTLGWQLASKSDDLDALRQQSVDNAHAEQVSLDYATAAADMDYQNPSEWSGRLTAGTSPELTTRLRQAATSMEQLIVPLQWTSSATPIAAKVESASDGVYEVTCFVNVLTKNLQAPDGIESTATYRMTIDSTNDWQITQISGIGSALPAQGDRAAEEAVPPK